MTRGPSLRLRLTLIILGPLLLVALMIGAWAWRDAQGRAAERFDRLLLSTALAISRDVALTGGDALSEATRDLLRDTSAGPVFYHVYAPDGVFVTGYATPPVPPDPVAAEGPSQTYYGATYLGQPVRALRISDTLSIDGLTGPFTFTVWQNTALRDGVVRSLTSRTAIVIASLMTALALLVWFGVRIGLRPLRDLERAIARRSAADLSPIRRPIPPEVSGVVGTLNRLLEDLARTITAKDVFISNAAHQLRNPVAGVLSLAESLESAPTEADLRERGADILDSARSLSRLADGLLALERAKATEQSSLVVHDVAGVLTDLLPRLERMCRERRIAFVHTVPNEPIRCRIDRLLLEEAVLNLVSNSLAHGGGSLSIIRIDLSARSGTCIIDVHDDGVGIAAADADLAMARFGQISPGEGSGLGLPIAASAVEAFGGTLSLVPQASGLKVRMEIPRA